MTEGDGVCKFWLFAKRIEVDGDAKWRANFVLSAVALTNIAIVVPGNRRVHLAKHIAYFSRLCHKLWLVFKKWRDPCFHRRNFWREFQVGASFASKFIFGVGA